MGLNPNLDEVCGRILGTKPLPYLQEAFSDVHRKESGRKLMLGVQTNEYFGMATQGNPSHPNENQVKKGRLRCEHCRKLGQAKDKCWGLHAKPPDYKPCDQSDHQSSGNVAALPRRMVAPLVRNNLMLSKNY